MPLAGMLCKTECVREVFFLGQLESYSTNINSWNYIYSVGIIEWVHMHCLRVDSYFLSILTSLGLGGYEKPTSRLLPRLCVVVIVVVVILYSIILEHSTMSFG